MLGWLVAPLALGTKCLPVLILLGWASSSWKIPFLELIILVIFSTSILFSLSISCSRSIKMNMINWAELIWSYLVSSVLFWHWFWWSWVRCRTSYGGLMPTTVLHQSCDRLRYRWMSSAFSSELHSCWRSLILGWMARVLGAQSPYHPDCRRDAS